MLKIFIISFVIIAFSIFAIAIKMFFFKGSSFKKECSCGKHETGNSCSSFCEEDIEKEKNQE
jgi:hypothetical protein